MAIAFSPLKNLDLHSTTSLLILYCLLAGLAELELEGKRLAIINNLKKPSADRRARVLFPFIEAGKGHIIPERAVCEIFKKKYGDKVEVIESKFYTETNDPHLESTEKLFAKGVQTQNKKRILSLLCRLGNFLAGDVFAQYVLMAMTISGRKSKHPAAKHLLSLDADLIFTTHWSIPFYLNHIIDKKTPHPYTVMFCPDVYSNGMFNMDCNRFLMPMKKGHDKIARFRMYAGGNTEVVSFPLREEIYAQEGRRGELRRLYGIEDDAFVVTLCDGGYGMANLEDTVRELLKAKEKMTLIALCGTNQELYGRMQKISTPQNIRLLPVPFTDRVLEYLALSDLFVGKSGANSMAEPAFLGVPIIITRCATYIERHIKDYYVHTLKGAMYIPSPKLAARKIIELAKEPQKLDKYKSGLADFRRSCGAEAIADMLYEALTELGYEPK
jgi:UDP-N-acetylglucosamine:LPS N-acetylglucosamine transferase